MPVRSERARRLPPAQRRAALVEATLPLVLRHGPGVTTQQIAQAAAVAEGTIFRVFATKEELIRAVTERVFDPAPALAQIAAIDRSVPLRARLVAVVAILQERLRTVIALILALGMKGPPRDENGEKARAAAAADEAFRAAIIELIDHDRALLRVPPQEVARVLRMLVFASTHPFINEGNQLTAEEIVGILLDGVSIKGDRPC